MKLYHGTALRHLDGIREHGLIPRGDRPGNWPEFPSRDDLVYLTTAYAPHFAKCAAKEKEPWVIVEIESDNLPDSLLPDEDFLEQATRKDPLLTGWSLAQRTKFFRSNIHDYAQYAQDSIESLGTCATAHVPISAIERYSIFDSTSNATVAYWMIDPTISVLNYQIKGSYYRLLSKWFFEPLTDSEVMELCLPIDPSLLCDDDKAKFLEDMEDQLRSARESLSDRSSLAVYAPAHITNIEVPR